MRVFRRSANTPTGERHVKDRRHASCLTRLSWTRFRDNEVRLEHSVATIKAKALLRGGHFGPSIMAATMRKKFGHLTS